VDNLQSTPEPTIAMSQSLNSALADRDVNASIASNAQVETAPGEENTKMQGEQHKAVSGLNG